MNSPEKLSQVNWLLCIWYWSDYLSCLLFILSVPEQVSVSPHNPCSSSFCVRGNKEPLIAHRRTQFHAWKHYFNSAAHFAQQLTKCSKDCQGFCRILSWEHLIIHWNFLDLISNLGSTFNHWYWGFNFSSVHLYPFQHVNCCIVSGYDYFQGSEVPYIFGCIIIIFIPLALACSAYGVVKIMNSRRRKIR